MDYKTKICATGTVTALAINNHSVDKFKLTDQGPETDIHATQHYDLRAVKFHDPDHRIGRHGERRDDAAMRGVIANQVVNTRTCSLLSEEELKYIEDKAELDQPIDIGVLSENIRICGIDHFSSIPPSFRIVGWRDEVTQWILTVSRPNKPCRVASNAVHNQMYGKDATQEFDTTFKNASSQHRGLLAFTYLAGEVRLGDQVEIVTPLTHPESKFWFDQI